MPTYRVRNDYIGRNGRRTPANHTVELSQEEGDRLVANGWGVPEGDEMPKRKPIRKGNTRTQKPTDDGLASRSDAAFGAGDLEL